ncbi:hypothetical protein Tco_1313490 [Tanacetum coccineum]
MKIKESLNVTFDETPSPSKTSPLVDNDLDEDQAVKVAEKKNLENNIEDETLEVDKIVNIKESKNHPLENDVYPSAYLVGTDTESKPFEGEAEASESPHTVASPTLLLDSTPPIYYAEESEGSDTSGVRSTSSDSTAPLWDKIRAYDCYVIIMYAYPGLVWSCPNFSALAGRPFRCVKSKVCERYWKRKDVTKVN